MGIIMGYSKDFVWGAASSAYQIEGAYAEDGKGPSIWDVFSHTPGKINCSHTGDIACNHYYDFQKEIAILKELGIMAYRFSISWPRIFPKGDQTLNPSGLAFYDRLVDELLASGITPYITLYHWDLPQVLEDIGGWTNREITVSFAYYAGFIAEHFSDRVTNFITINEPQCIAFLGYSTGIHAPGKKLETAQVLKVFHHLALAHGKAVTSMREKAVQRIQIGFSSTGNLCFPGDSTQEDIGLARRLSFEMTKESWGFTHTWFCDGVILGKYPDISSLFPDISLDFIQTKDMEIIAKPVDFFGVNVYNGHEVSSLLPDYYVPKYEGFPRTALKWPITPGVMNWGLRFLYERYQLPIYVTENGLSCNDKVYLDGKVHDPERIDFLHRYLIEMEKAVQEDIPILGYFQWSLTDNFEWHSGYSERFGLVYVDYPTQKRIIKDSAYWYSDFITDKSSVLST